MYGDRPWAYNTYYTVGSQRTGDNNSLSLAIFLAICTGMTTQNVAKIGSIYADGQSKFSLL